MQDLLTSTPAHYRIDLPWPPSTNTYYRIFRNRAVLSPQGRVFHAAATRALEAQQLTGEGISQAVRVRITLHPPTWRGYDVDNRLKAVLDALTKNGVWLDDEQVVSLQAEKGLKQAKGAAEVRIYLMDKDYTEWHDNLMSAV